MDIKKVVVIGSGTMGSGIAAHLCNANVPVTLLDLTTEISEKARDRIHKSRPPLLLDKTKIENIKVGNINDNFDVVKEADWVVEAVVERIDIKHNIYEKIFKNRKQGAIVSSNTSSIPIKVLSEKLTDEEKKDFCITHFFNPVRYMGLLEIVKNENNDLNKINSLKKFCEIELGKGAIVCNDTPGFLGNRIGVYAMQVAMTEAFKMKLSIEEADAVFGRPMGIPKTGVFGLYDLIGIDLMADVLKSFIKELSDNDEFQIVAKEIPLVKKLIDTGYTGRKGKGGFYRMNKSGNQKVLEAINLETGEYTTSKKIDLGIETVDINNLINQKDKYGEYAWEVISKIIKYASSLVPGITDKFNDIDEAMRLGFNWALGPFEMLKSIGVENFFSRIDNFENNKFLQNLSKSKDENFYGERQLYTDIETLGKIRPTAIKVDKNNSAEIHRFKDFNIVEFTTKACALDYDSMDALKNATDKPLIVMNESMQFSAGVNLSYTMNFADKNDFKSIEKFIKYFQDTCKTLKYSKYPVVSAPSGLTLGGGFEVLVQSNFVASHTNIVVGLVETIVGLVPAGGGCKEMLWRWSQTNEAKSDPDYAPLKVFDIIGYAKTATSPVEAEPLKYLKPEDKKIMNRNSLFEEAKKLIHQNNDFVPPEECKFNLSGKPLKEKMIKVLEKLYNDKIILDHGMHVGTELANVLSGGDTNLDKTLSEDDLYKLELDSFMRLIETKQTQERIKHTLSTGKPLVN
ncbi:3-hydroxyacyl-CoA dehydrogenase/enoyl-CoA hydratase family protein [Candidatus Pelagibacter communis]|uniref:3-hydroxyacyl-CoA dehydrogenase/enoyl-CoA hydratase family protein n=1 Tax=Pelagibacter ubique TaxID=198252 RepID=UPI00065B3E38|nr:3-hydroxyacyl-CoA dehydrogenase/enoyl-CoA hydratase family protein [Candidatus Pelagibacter ubique]